MKALKIEKYLEVVPMYKEKNGERKFPRNLI